MKDLVWDKILSVGIDEIDEDHRKLVNIFNILNLAINDRSTPQYLAAVLDELINCTVWHFSHEERLMLKYNYDRFDEHKTEHRELIKSAKELQQKVLQSGCLVAHEDLEFLEQWLTEHILSADMKLGSFLAEVM